MKNVRQYYAKRRTKKEKKYRVKILYLKKKYFIKVKKSQIF